MNNGRSSPSDRNVVQLVHCVFDVPVSCFRTQNTFHYAVFRSGFPALIVFSTTFPIPDHDVAEMGYNNPFSVLIIKAVVLFG